MATNKLSTSKSICVLAVVICCFAILWPKIFFPMFQQALTIGSKINDDNQPTKFPSCRRDIFYACGISLPEIDDTSKNVFEVDLVLEQKLHEIESCIDLILMSKENTNQIEKIATSKMHPRMNGIAEQEKVHREAGRPFRPLPNRQEAPPQPAKSSGLFGIFMPVYTVGIAIFFLYTIFKLTFKKQDEEDENEQLAQNAPILNDYHMDPEHRKFVFSDEYDDSGLPIRSTKRQQRLRKEAEKQELKAKSKSFSQKPLNKTEKVIKAYGKDKEENEIYLLQRQLEEAEKSLQMLVEHMNVVSKKLASRGILPAATYDHRTSIIDEKDAENEKQSDNENENENTINLESTREEIDTEIHKELEEDNFQDESLEESEDEFQDPMQNLEEVKIDDDNQIFVVKEE